MFCGDFWYINKPNLTPPPSPYVATVLAMTRGKYDVEREIDGSEREKESDSEFYSSHPHFYFL